MKVVSIVGARPQFIKAAAVSRSLRERHHEILVHTGQHYDYEMSGIFFDGLDIPAPDVSLAVGSGSHATQTAAMLKGIEDVLIAERPDWLLIYGDTNSTLAGALAASKVSTPIAHVEAGLRSFNRRMPEEINRIVADHLSTLLLVPSEAGVANLRDEGIVHNVHLIGDVMLDVLRWAVRRAEARPSLLLECLGVEKGGYLLATVHRAENTDDSSRLSAIVNAFNSIGEPIVFPMHPRARRLMREAGLSMRGNVKVIDPVSYLDMVTLARSARLILTDSGGLQKEAYWLGVPCVTLRDETEWVETVDAGWNLLVGADAGRIGAAVESWVPRAERIPLYGDGSAAAACVELLTNGACSAEAATRRMRAAAPSPEAIHAECVSH